MKNKCHLLTAAFFLLPNLISLQIHDELSDERNESSQEFLHNSFAGDALTDAYTCFQGMAAGIDETKDDKALSCVSDCHRVCSALLRCAGMMPEDRVPKLAETITSAFADPNTNSSAARQAFTLDNVVPQVALLCLWDHTKDVAKILSSSIVTYFDGDGTTMMEDEDESHSPKKQMPVSMAIAVLQGILGGTDSSSIAARDAILLSENALHDIECALKSAFTKLKTVFDSSEVSRGPI
jgi:hypothetical protein